MRRGAGCATGASGVSGARGVSGAIGDAAVAPALAPEREASMPVVSEERDEEREGLAELGAEVRPELAAEFGG